RRPGAICRGSSSWEGGFERASSPSLSQRASCSAVSGSIGLVFKTTAHLEPVIASPPPVEMPVRKSWTFIARYQSTNSHRRFRLTEHFQPSYAPPDSNILCEQSTCRRHASAFS